MSVSIDGKIHKGSLRINYGEEFPIPRRSMEIQNETYGLILIYLISVGRPSWNSRLQVVVPIRYYITSIISPSKEYEKNQRMEKLGFKLIEGAE